MKYFILLNIFIVNLFATFLINETFNNSSLSQNMSFIIKESNEKILPTEILESNQLNIVNKSNLGLQLDKQIWTKVTIKNTTNQQKTIYLYNPRAAIDFIDVYIFKDFSLVKNYFLGDTRELQNRDVFSRFSTLKITFQPQEEFTLITKISNPYGRIDIEWISICEEEFHKFIIKDSIIWGLILSGIIFILIFQWLFYKVLKNDYFIYYLIFSITTLLYLIFYNGFGYLIFGSSIFNNLMPHITGYSIVLLYTLFLDKLLNLSKTSKLNKIILKVIYFYAIFTASTSWIICFSPIIYSFDNYFFMFYLTSMLVLIMISIKVIFENKKIAIYYLIGQISVLVGYLILVFNAFGILKTTTYTQQQILGLTVLIEMFFFAYAISIKMKLIYFEKEKNTKLFLSQSNFASIGQTLRNVAHQWKIPMVRFGTLITELETTIICKKLYDSRIEEVFNQLRLSIDFMGHTVEEFRNFYLKKENIRIFKPCEEIEEILMLLIEKINDIGAKIEFTENSKLISISDYDRSFTHISMIILDNFLEIAEKRKIPNPTIIIDLKNETNLIKISFIDNCGGISQMPINTIFDLEVSSNNEEYRGCGLAIAKMLVEEKLKGTIIAKNISNGAMFKLILPIKQNK